MSEWQPIDTAPNVKLVQVYGPIIGGFGSAVGVGMWCQSWGGWWTHSINGMMKSCGIDPIMWAPLNEPPV